MSTEIQAQGSHHQASAMSAPSLFTRVWSVVWSAILAFLILGLGQGVWGALLLSNLKTTPAIPWAVAVMAVVLWLTFFALVWPYDTKRQLVWETGADRWFWLHTAQAIISTALAIVAFSRLARVSEGVRAQESQ